LQAYKDYKKFFKEIRVLLLTFGKICADLPFCAKKSGAAISPRPKTEEKKQWTK
jgi:hypothetical protein